MTGLRPMLRLAWRSIRRNPGRSALVFCLIALMVGASTAIATLARTTMTNDDDVQMELLGEADLRISIARNATRLPTLPTATAPAELDPDATAAVVGALLSSEVVANRWLTLSDEPDSSVLRNGPYGTTDDQQAPALVVSDIDPTAQIHSGMFDITSGHAPATGDEILLPHRLAEQERLDLGDTWLVADESFTLVGTTRQRARQPLETAVVTIAGFDRIHRSDQAAVVDLWLFARSAETAARTPELDRRVSEALGVTPDEVGLLFDPSTPAGPGLRNDAGRFVFGADVDLVAPDRRPSQLSTLVASLLAVEVALVAGAAFAVSIRRRIREFGQLLATGADHGHVTVLVVIEAVVLGALGALAGAAGGVLVATMVHRGGLTGTTIESNELRWHLIDWLGPTVVGIAAAGFAAWVPAQRLKRLSPLAALSGHLPVERPQRRTPTRGLALLLVGTAGVAGSSWLLLSFDSTSLVAPAIMIVSVLAMFVGALSAIGHLLQWIGDRADRLGLTTRLVVRNSARHQSRSWAAIGAFVALIAVPVVIAASIKGYPATGSNPPPDRARLVSVAIDGGLRFVGADIDGYLTRIGPPLPGQPADNQTFIDALDAAIGEIAPLDDRLEWQRVNQPPLLAVGPDEGLTWEGGSTLGTVATPGLMSLLGLDDDDLADDHALLVNASQGTHEVWFNSGEGSGPRLPVQHRVGHDIDARGWVMVTEAFVEAHTLSTSVGGAVWTLSEAPDKATRARIESAANDAWLEVWGGEAAPSGLVPVPRLSIGLDHLAPTSRSLHLLTIAVAGSIAALIALIAAALAAVEVDREIGSMIATGAPPAIRRWLLGVQTTYHLIIAAIIGAPLAVLVFWAGSRADDNGPPGVVVPWTMIIAMGVVAPIAIGAIIALVFRNGRPAVSRRIA